MHLNKQIGSSRIKTAWNRSQLELHLWVVRVFFLSSNAGRLSRARACTHVPPILVQEASGRWNHRNSKCEAMTFVETQDWLKNIKKRQVVPWFGTSLLLYRSIFLGGATAHCKLQLDANGRLHGLLVQEFTAKKNALCHVSPTTL